MSEVEDFRETLLTLRDRAARYRDVYANLVTSIEVVVALPPWADAAPAAPAEDQAVSRSHPPIARRPFTESAHRVLDALADGPRSAKDLSHQTGLSPKTLAGLLTSLLARQAITKTGKYNTALYRRAPDPSTT